VSFLIVGLIILWAKFTKGVTVKNLLFFLVLIPSFAFAFPEAPVDNLNFRPAVLKGRHAVSYDFEGIVKLSNCSGSLVKFHGQSDEAKAVVMTNGHCIQKPGGYLNPGEVWVNKPLMREMKIFKTKTLLHPITSTKILYATMTNTDVAFYELTESYSQILARTGVAPFSLSDVHPSENTEIEIISGYWERGYSCAIDGFVAKLKEGEWLFTDSIRYTAGCDTIGGTSGSPIIERGTKNVIAINNTSNESGARCTLNNPCEVGSNGEIFAQKGLRYGQQTFNVYSCLTQDFKFDLTLEDCALPK
jgi:V8-like Glu-specific endopeptidase